MKQVFIRISILCISCLGALILAELIAKSYFEIETFKKILRDWDIQPHLTTCYQISDQLGYEANWGNCRYPKLFAYTSKENPIKLSDSRKYRIIALGDSVLHGGFLTEKLENTLNSSDNNPSLRFEVINMGTAGYNTVQEVKLLKLRALDLHPQMVILLFTLNDFEYSHIVLRQNNKLAWFYTNGEIRYESNETLFRLSSLYRYIKYKQLTTRILPDDAQWVKKKEYVSKALDEFKTILSREGIQALVVVFPLFTNEQPEPSYSTILQLLREKNIDYINMLPVFTREANLASLAGVEDGKTDIIHPDFQKTDLPAAQVISDYITIIVSR